MINIVSAALIALGMGAQGAFAAEGSALDVEPREFGDSAELLQLKDLAVGESGYVHREPLCVLDDRLYLTGNAILTTRSKYLLQSRVTVKPDRRLSLVVVPGEKAAGRVKLGNLGFVGWPSDCNSRTSDWPTGAPLYRIDSINGHTNLSPLVDVLAPPANPRASIYGRDRRNAK